mgnify:CR=1 FL=1
MNNYNLKNIVNLFPCLGREGGKMIYFDNAATTQKPTVVIEAIADFYINGYSNIHRSAHSLGFTATQKYEHSRGVIRQFISARESDEIIFTSGATESINLVANSFGKNIVNENDIILVSEIEHHSNMLPWQQLAKEKGAKIKKIPLNKDLTIDIESMKRELNNSVKLVVAHHLSNVTGIMQNIKEVVSVFRDLGIPVFVDGAQAPAHIRIDVKDLNCDFYCFSGHKAFGPTGTGVLFIKEESVKKMSPYKMGGQMVSRASLITPEWAEPPLKFEAGTPNISGVIGLSAAIQFIENVGVEKITLYEEGLKDYMLGELNKIPELIIYGEQKKTAPIFSFNVAGVHHSDLATLLSENNILVRSGHLCNQGLMNYLNIDGCVRVSLAFYNSIDEIDRFIVVLKKILSFLNK